MASSLTTMPAEVLLEIFKCKELEPVDLKNVRLASPKAFGTVAGDVLFHTLPIHFVDGVNNGNKTTLLKRIRQMVEGPSSSSEVDTFRNLNFREISIIFSSTNRLGLVTFALKLAEPLLELFEHLHVLKIAFDKTGDMSYTPYSDSVSATMKRSQRRFFSMLQRRCGKGGFNLRRLDCSGLPEHLGKISSLTSLKSLRLSIEPAGMVELPGGYKIQEDIAKVIANNLGLEELSLRYLHGGKPPGGMQLNWYLQSRPDLVNRLALVLDSVKTPELKIKKLELDRFEMPLPGKGQIGKVAGSELEALVLKSYSMPKSDCRWQEMQSLGVQLKEIHCTSPLGPQLLQFLRAQRRLRKLTLLSSPGYDRHRDRISSIHTLGEEGLADLDKETAKFSESFQQFVFPSISKTLTTLTIDVEGQLVGGGLFECRVAIGCHLLVTQPIRYQAAPGGTYRKADGGEDPGNAFNELMHLLRPFSCLGTLSLKLYPVCGHGTLMSTNTLDYHAKEENKDIALRYLHVSQDWKYEPWFESNDSKDLWNEGLLLKVRMPIWDEEEQTTVFKGGKASWVLRENEWNEPWSFA